MVKKESRVIKSFVSIICIVTLLLTLLPIAHAESSWALTAFNENSRFSIGVLNTNNGWFVNAEDLARIGNFSIGINKEQKTITICKKTPFVILYTADDKTYIENNNIYYIPFQEASVAIGIRFYEIDNDLHFEVLRTPKELIAEMSENVFGNHLFRLSDLILDMDNSWIVAETCARGYAMLSSFSLSAYLKALSGEEDQEKYNHAMASILANDEDSAESFEVFADINKFFTKTDKILDTIDWINKKSSKFLYWLNGSSWEEAEFKAVLDQIEFYGEYGGVREFLEGYSDVSKKIDLKHLFSVILYIESVREAEESIVNAMQTVFSESDNQHARLSALKAVESRYGVSFDALTDDIIIETTTKGVDSLFTDLVFGELDWKTKVKKFIATQVFDYGFQLKDKANAIIYFPIYSAIQQDLALYYYNNYHNYTDENVSNLRSIGIMYLKAAIEAYKNCKFDAHLNESVSQITGALKSELNELIGYAECEYAPDYTNQVAIDKLNQGGVFTKRNTSDQDTIFDETFWQCSFGQTLGSSFVALFHKNGTFTAQHLGSGEFDEGTYTFQNGTLTINFWFTGDGCVFEQDESGFVSRQKYEMQVGEDYYHIILDDSIKFINPFEPSLNNPTPSPAPSPLPTPLATNDTLPDGEYFGFLTAWSEDSMTIELLTYSGRNENSFNYVFIPTGRILCLDICKAVVGLEYAWGESANSQYDTIDTALDAEVWESSKLREQCSMEIYFTIVDSQVNYIEFLFAA